jgi:transcriptional regulator with XRE-family HTH domain
MYHFGRGVVALREQLGEELTAAMKKKGVSAQQVADDLDMSVNAVRAWTNGRFGPPDSDRMQKLQEYFGRKFLADPVQENGSNQGKGEAPFTIALAKQKLAATLGVSEDQIEITIRG